MPLRLEPDLEQITPHGTYRMAREGEVFGLQLRLDDRWETMYQFTLAAQTRVDFEVANWFTSTHPRSLFTQNLVVCRVVGENSGQSAQLKPFGSAPGRSCRATRPHKLSRIGGTAGGCYGLGFADVGRGDLGKTAEATAPIIILVGHPAGSRIDRPYGKKGKRRGCRSRQCLDRITKPTRREILHMYELRRAQRSSSQDHVDRLRPLDRHLELLSHEAVNVKLVHRIATSYNPLHLRIRGAKNYYFSRFPDLRHFLTELGPHMFNMRHEGFGILIHF